MQGNRPGVKPFVEAMARRVVACRGVRRANAGAEGINRRQFFAPEGDSDVPSGFAKNGGAHECPADDDINKTLLNFVPTPAGIAVASGSTKNQCPVTTKLSF
jgi:hypothetical protein